MIRLTKQDLLELADVYIVANTPNSLFKGLSHCRAVEWMRRKSSAEELSEYYDHITARACRSEIVIGLAYGVLVALLTFPGDGQRILPDCSRLNWGEKIRDYVTQVYATTNTLIIAAPRLTAEVQPISSNSAPIVLRSDGRPAR